MSQGTVLATKDVNFDNSDLKARRWSEKRLDGGIEDIVSWSGWRRQPPK
jgi:hypothetical protein